MFAQYDLNLRTKICNDPPTLEITLIKKLLCKNLIRNSLPVLEINPAEDKTSIEISRKNRIRRCCFFYRTSNNLVIRILMRNGNLFPTRRCTPGRDDALWLTPNFCCQQHSGVACNWLTRLYDNLKLLFDVAANSTPNGFYGHLFRCRWSTHTVQRYTHSNDHQSIPATGRTVEAMHLQPYRFPETFGERPVWLTWRTSSDM